jgi:hypothetical protein
LAQIWRGKSGFFGLMFFHIQGAGAMHFRGMLSGLAVLGLLVGGAVATPVPGQGIFTYSGLCRDGDSGRLIGSRLTIVRRGNGDTVTYEWTRPFTPGDSKKPFGDLESPGLWRATAKGRIDADGSLAVVLGPSPGVPRTVRGSVTSEGFELSGFEARIWLPRQYKPSKDVPACRP